MNQVDKKYIILGSLCAVLLTLVVGYAAFNTVLNINGTSNISSNWDVKITGIEKVTSKGSIDVEGTPKFDNLSATFNTNLVAPGDYATYKIEITNNGSIDAVLKNITMPENTNNDIIFYLNKDQTNTDILDTLKQNDTLFKKGETGNVGYVYVTVSYRDYENQKTATTKTQSMTISFDFEEADGNVTPIPQPQTVYAFHTDTKTIGTSKLTESEYVTDYTELDSYKAGETWFLKYDIDSERIIQNAYACQKFSFIDEPVCIQGGNVNYYASNKAILEGLQTKFTANSGSCSYKDSNSICDVNHVRVISYADGRAYAHYDVGIGAGCFVLSDGSMNCTNR